MFNRKAVRPVIRTYRFFIAPARWHEVPMSPLEGEVPNEREAEGFVRKLSKKTPQSARSGCQLLIAE